MRPRPLAENLAPVFKFFVVDWLLGLLRCRRCGRLRRAKTLEVIQPLLSTDESGATTTGSLLHAMIARHNQQAARLRRTADELLQQRVCIFVTGCIEHGDSMFDLPGRRVLRSLLGIKAHRQLASPLCELEGQPAHERMSCSLQKPWSASLAQEA